MLTILLKKMHYLLPVGLEEEAVELETNEI